MARILSLVFIVFLAVPIAAPSIGQLIMLIAPWRWIFGATAAFAIFVTGWVIVRLPETLHREDRMPIAFGRITDALGLICTNRVAVGYTLATALMTGGMFGFINSSQQIFAEVFRAPHLFPLVFAVAASGMAISALLNARIVVRLGARRVSHMALCLFIGWALAHVAIALCGLETIWTFALCQAGMMFFFGMVPSNFSATSMEPLGHVAGTASSVQGFVTLLGGGLLGAAVGQAYNGTVMPMLFSFVALGAAALLVIVITERGRLFPSAPPLPAHALADPITQAADSLLS
jgi:DHA1 family bicyclomycin/chloramphenicol resistance-like MFS transporter